VRINSSNIPQAAIFLLVARLGLNVVNLAFTNGMASLDLGSRDAASIAAMELQKFIARMRADSLAGMSAEDKAAHLQSLEVRDGYNALLEVVREIFLVNRVILPRDLSLLPTDVRVINFEDSPWLFGYLGHDSRFGPFLSSFGRMFSWMIEDPLRVELFRFGLDHQWGTISAFMLASGVGAVAYRAILQKRIKYVSVKFGKLVMPKLLKVPASIMGFPPLYRFMNTPLVVRSYKSLITIKSNKWVKIYTP